MMTVPMLSIIYAHFAKWRYDKCRYGERRGAVKQIFDEEVV